MRRIVSLLIIVLISGLLPAAAQKRKPDGKQLKEPAKQEKKLMAVFHFVTDSGVKIRWSFANAGVWLKSIKLGVTIERYTIARDGQQLKKIELTQFPKRLVKPMPLADSTKWKSLFNKNKYAAVMAQALYGKNFKTVIPQREPASQKGDPMATALVESEVMENRYLFFYYSADMFFEGACAAGTGFMDSTIKQNEQYFYRVYANLPAQYGKIDTAMFVVDGKTRSQLPEVPELNAIFGNKAVTLAWSHAPLAQHYTAYNIDKSTDSLQWTRVNNLPFTPVENTLQEKQTDNSMTFFNDTLAVNDKIYWYRIKGISPFGEEAKTGTYAKGMGSDILIYIPNIKNIDFKKDGKVQINWEFDPAGDSLIKGFDLYFSLRSDTGFKKVQSIPDPSARTTLFDVKDQPGYYKIQALAKNNMSTISFPYLIQPEDSLPPLPPTGLKGFVDSSGFVILDWKPNTERDFVGYQVFKKNHESEEYQSITDTLYKDTIFFDRIAIKLLNRKVYYKIRAIDRRFNPSAFSDSLVLKKPDIIPPSAPVFAGYEVLPDRVKLVWVNATDEDVTKTLLVRKSLSDLGAKWDTIKVFGKSKLEQTAFDDQQIDQVKTYMYSLVALDESGNASPPANPITVATQAQTPKKAIKFTDATVDRDARTITLNWAAQVKDVTSFELFRKEDKEGLTLYKTLPASTIEFVDRDLRINVKYKYGLRAVLKDGRFSELIYKEINY